MGNDHTPYALAYSLKGDSAKEDAWWANRDLNPDVTAS